jgi:hypothetical protein
MFLRDVIYISVFKITFIEIYVFKLGPALIHSQKRLLCPQKDFNPSFSLSK